MPHFIAPPNLVSVCKKNVSCIKKGLRVDLKYDYLKSILYIVKNYDNFCKEKTDCSGMKGLVLDFPIKFKFYPVYWKLVV